VTRVPIRVPLTPAERFLAAQLGVYRRLSSRANGYNTTKHTPNSNWTTDIDGSFCEMAMAKWLGIYFHPTEGDFKGSDVGRRCQTRSTRHVDGHLIVRRNDEPIKQHKFVLGIIEPNAVLLVGWIVGENAMLADYWREDHWEVPQHGLFDMDVFPRWEAMEPGQG
jgi:hypothetical protein